MIFQISDEINELAVKARDGKLTADEMKVLHAQSVISVQLVDNGSLQLSITQK